MSTVIQNKLNQMLSNWIDGAVFCTSWLIENGYYDDLIRRYKNSNWIETIGSGAYKKKGDKVEWAGGLQAAQSQLHLKVHVAGKSALELQGKAQYLAMNQKQILVAGTKKEQLPAWLRKYDWGVVIKYQVKKLFDEKETDFGTKSFGYTQIEFGRLTVTAAATERAYLEYLDELPKKYSYREALEILENLPSMRSGVLQTLLENCTSLKVKRLFLHFAEKVNHPWYKKIDLKKINLGKGKRLIFKNGMLDSKYLITIPKDAHDQEAV